MQEAQEATVDDSGDLPESPVPVTQGPTFRSVRGWLLLFCVTLVLTGPAVTAFTLATSYMTVLQLADRFPGFAIVSAIDAVLSAALMAFSVYAGVALLRIRPGAVDIAKRFLLTTLAYRAVVVVLPLFAGLPSSANAAVRSVVLRQAIQGLIYVAVWDSYLGKSKRVMATYGSRPSAWSGVSS